MLELLEKAVMTSIGVVAITEQKTEELVAEMKERFRLTEGEGQHLSDRIKAMALESRGRVDAMAESEVSKIVTQLGLVSRDEFDRLSQRVQELEKRHHV